MGRRAGGLSKRYIKIVEGGTGRLILAAGVLALAACETDEAVTRRTLGAWTGRPVSEFVAAHSWPPDHVYDAAGERTYIFRRYGFGAGCGATLWAKPGSSGDYLIDRWSTTCGSAAFH